MKKYIILLAALVGFSASAQNSLLQYRTEDFLQGLGNMVVSNNTTITNFSTNVPYLNPQAIYVFSGSNISVIATNANGNSTNIFVIPNWWKDVNLFPNINGDVNTNSALTFVFNSTNVFFPANERSVPNPNNPNNVTNWLAPIGLLAASTNNVTFTFYSSADSRGNAYGPAGNFGSYTAPAQNPNTFANYDAHDIFTCKFFAQGLTNYIVTTNFPATFIAGKRFVRLISVVTDNAASSPGVVVNKVSYGGWGP